MSNIWQDIKDRVSVDEVIQDYIPIISQGGSYKALCPFHNEKTPSLVISPDKGIWHCFGCGAGGDIFAFVSDIENITKKEALTKLAKKAGIKLESQHNNLEEKEAKAQSVNSFESGLKLLEWSSDIYHKILLKVTQDRKNPITQYCLNRGLTQEIIQKFKLGYAPKNNLVTELVRKYNIDYQTMQAIGVLKLKSSLDQAKVKQIELSMLSDKFVDRLVIPIFDKQSRIIGFTARVLPYDNIERPKYLNSPQTDWFNKSNIWYGWSQSRPQIIQNKKALIVEGNMDVVSSFRHGFDFTLASQGTSFTENQLKLLKNLTRVVWLAFDNDEAGKLSSDKFFKSASLLEIEVNKVVIPKEYKDLDEYLNSEKPTQLNVIPYLDWVLQSKSSLIRSSDSQVQKENILKLLDLISTVSPISREQYLKKLSALSKISIATLQSLLKPVATGTGKTEGLGLGEQEDLVNLEQLAYNNLQNFISGVTAYFPTKTPLVWDCYTLLNQILPQLSKFRDMDDFLKSNQDIFDLISSQKQELSELSVLEVIWKSLIHYLDNHLSSFILDSNLKAIYLKLKGINFLNYS